MSTISQRLEEGLEAHQAGRLAEAERGYRDVLGSEPAHPDAVLYLGVLLMDRKEFGAAIELLRHAAQLAPGNVLCHANLGSALLEAGDGPAALAAFDHAIGLAPDAAEIINARGNVLLKMELPDRALRDFTRAVALRPRNYAYYNNAGNAYRQLGRIEEALEYFDHAIALAPDQAAPHSNRGNALLLMQRPAEALINCREAVRRDPHHVDALHNCGCALLDLGRAAEAQSFFEAAIALSPVHVKALFNLGITLRTLRSYEQAAECFARVYELEPKRPYVLGSLVLARRYACSWSELGGLESRLIEAVARGEPAAYSTELFLVSDSPALGLACAGSYVKREFGSISGRGAIVAPPSDRLKIAYLSADFNEHATAHLTAELFEKHDRDGFEVIGVAFTSADGSQMRRRLERGFDKFMDASALADAEVTAALREFGVHIAIDLKGLTAGNRLGVFARRCAPIQVAYLGHPGTTGADFMDYLIADRVVVPEQDRRWYTEKVVYLPDSYQVNDTRREVAMLAPARAQVGLPEESFVYCCFNACYKITLALFAVWMKLLKRVPRSVLWLLDDNQAATRNLRNEAERAGVASERLIFAPRALPADHLARYRLADLFVDTLPVGAHTTASEALWAGLPVLTCAGDAFPGRVGASLLRAAGLPELIAENMTQYEALALDLAAAPERLRALRERLTLRRDTCALFDINRFCGHLESAYRSMWQNYQSGEPATGFAVTPLGPGLGDDP